MSLLPSISRAEFGRFSGGWLSRLALVAIMLIPSIYGGLLVGSNRDVTTHLSGMRAAVVDEDQTAYVTDDKGVKTAVSVGRSVTDRLVDSDDPQNLSWEETDARTAEAGLRDGTYYAVLTIPRGFSAAATSTQDADTARSAVMDLQTNDAVSYLSGNIAKSIGTVVANETGDELSARYLDRVYVGLNEVKSSLTEAGEGAGKLTDGSAGLAKGASRLEDGSGRLVVGLRDLASGADRLDAGTRDLATGTSRVASGAGSLSAGATRVANGNAELARGLAQLSSATATMPAQATKLADGAAKVAAGNKELATGASTLRDGLVRLDEGTSKLPAQSRALADGATSLAEGATEVSEGGRALAGPAAELTRGAATLTTGAESLGTAASRLAPGASAVKEAATTVSGGAKDASTAVTTYTAGVSDLARDCEESGASAAYCARLARVADQGEAVADGSASVARGAEKVSAGANSLSDGVSALADGATQVAGGATRFADGATTYASGATRVADGAGRLAPGATRLRDGVTALAQAAPQLAQGVSSARRGSDRLASATSQLATGSAAVATGTKKLAAAAPRLADGLTRSAAASRQLASGSAKVADGASDLSTGARRAAGGAGRLADGAGELSSGTHRAQSGAEQLDDGAGKVSDGARKLTSGSADLEKGLKDGAEKAPSYTAEERERLGDVVSAPVKAEVSRDNAVGNYGAGMAPYFSVLGLWVGAMSMFFVIRPLPARAIASTAATWRVVLAGYLTPALLGVGQAALAVMVVTFGVGIDVAHLPALVLMAVLTSLTFVAINQALVAALGTKGRFVALILVVLQLSASGATYPIETSPGFFRWLHPLLPLTYGVQAFRALIAGGGPELGGAVVALLVWIAGAWLVTAVAARSQRMWTPERLHPRAAV